MSSPATASIKASDISQEFIVNDQKAAVIKNVSFDILDKTFNIIYGASGSGKSTLLNILSGLQKPTTGNVMLSGQNVYSLSPDELAYFRANQIGIVYQQNYWVKSLSVLDNIAMPLFFSGQSRRQANRQAMQALEQVQMQQFAHKYPVVLSGGEQQRIAMARAIVNDPLFIIADEPTGSLDSKNGDMIMDLLQQWQAQFGRTIILVTHNMEYLPLADHLLHVQDGMVTPMLNNDIRRTTETLIGEMKQRIDNLSVKKAHQRSAS